MTSVDPARRLDADSALEALRLSARKVVSKLLRHRMREHVNSKMVRCIDLGFDPAAEEVAAPIADAAKRSLERLSALSEKDLTKEVLSTKQEEWKAEIEQAFGNGQWKVMLPGREILKAFVDDQRLPIPYEALRNLIVSKMVDAGFQPAGMKKVISSIVEASTKA